MNTRARNEDSDEAVLEEIVEEIKANLAKAPEGASKQKLFAESSAESMFILSKALHALIETGEVINLTGTSLGPYISSANLQAAPKTSEVELASQPRVVRVQAEVSPQPVRPTARHNPHSVVPLQPQPQPSAKGLTRFTKLGSLNPRHPLGCLAYAVYLIGVDKPDIYVTYDYVIDRIPEEFKARGIYAKGRANLFRMLDASGYCDRHYDPARPKSPGIKWNFKRFGYPFPSLEIKPWPPAGEEVRAEAPKPVAPVRVPPIAKEPSVQRDQERAQVDSEPEVLEPVFADSDTDDAEIKDTSTVEKGQRELLKEFPELDCCTLRGLLATASSLATAFQNMSRALGEFVETHQKLLR